MTKIHDSVNSAYEEATLVQARRDLSIYIHLSSHCEMLSQCLKIMRIFSPMNSKPSLGGITTQNFSSPLSGLQAKLTFGRVNIAQFLWPCRRYDRGRQRTGSKRSICCQKRPTTPCAKLRLTLIADSVLDLKIRVIHKWRIYHRSLLEDSRNGTCHPFPLLGKSVP